MCHVSTGLGISRTSPLELIPPRQTILADFTDEQTEVLRRSFLRVASLQGKLAGILRLAGWFYPLSLTLSCWTGNISDAKSSVSLASHATSVFLTWPQL